MNDRFKFRIPGFTDKGSFIGFQYVELGDEIECTLCGYNSEPQQCTSLKDKNGKLIYEGDIVRVYPYEYNGEIIFENYSYLLSVNLTYLGVQKLFLVELEKTKMNLEIIGNVYENKELLEDTECQKLKRCMRMQEYKNNTVDGLI